MTFCISATDKTKEIYPFEFIFSVKYTLCGKGLKVTYNVKNVGNNKMYFGLGGHPGFNVPFNGGKFEDYYLEFEKDCSPTQIILDDDGLVSEERVSYVLKDGKKINLYHSMFDRDAVVLTDVCRSVYLKDPNGERSIKVEFPDMSYLGFWHMPKTDAPYVRIEPWMTLPSNAGEPEVLETKENVGVVESGKEFITDMIISINE
jgi:galactose mutarotase-like enzyme